MIRDFKISLSYAIRDLRAGLSGFYIFLICILLSVAIIATVQSLSLGMKDSIRNNGRYILGGDISLEKMFEPASKEQIDYLRRYMGPTSVVIETRAMARTQDGNKSSLVELKGVDPFYPLYGELEIIDANNVVQKLDKDIQNLLVPEHADIDHWGALVEKELLSRLNVKVGDWINIGNQKFEIRGVISKEPDRLAGKQFTIAPRIMISNYVFDKTGLTAKGAQVEYKHNVLLPQVKSFEDLEKAKKRINDAFPKADWNGKDFLNASPRAERMINRLTLFLTFVGLTTLLIAGIGISNAVRAFLDNKMADIATFKCLGAKQGFVFKIYMTEMLLLSSIAIIAGLLLSLVLSKTAGHFLTAQLALENSVGIYPKALLVSAALGYLITFAASLWPIGKAIKTSPANLFRDLFMPVEAIPNLSIIVLIIIAAQLIALTSFTLTTDIKFMSGFLIGTIFTFALFYLFSVAIKFLIKKVHIPSNPEIRMALANIHRPGNITSSTILSIGLGLTVLISVAIIQNNFTNLLGKNLAEDAPSFFFLDIQHNQLDKFKEIVNNFESAKKLIITPSFRGRVVSVNGVPAEKALVDKNEEWIIRADRGFTYMKSDPSNSKILEGKWWPEDYKGEPIVSIATNVQRAFNIGVGDKLTVKILGREITATIANVRDVNWGNFTINFATTFAPGVLDNMPSTSIATVIVDKDKEEALQNILAKEFPNVTSVKVGDALAVAKTMITSVSQAVSISAIITLIAGILVLSGGIAAARKRHLYDSIIFKVLGATRKKIVKTFIFEYAFLGFITIILSTILGSITAYWIQGFMMDIAWEFNFKALAYISLCSLIITLGAGLLGTMQVFKQKPAQYLRNE